jgi:glycosyltransferase involved in cell wall biosynthesis
MYIAHITYDDVKNPWCGGGGAKRVFEVDRRLAKRHKVKVFTGKYINCKDEIIDSVVFKRIGFGFNYIISRITFSIFIPFYVLREKFDIVVNEFSAYSPSFFFSRKRKNIIAIHHLVGKSPIKKYKIIGIFPYFFEKIIGNFYDYIITVSPSVTDIVRKKYKKGKIFRLIYNGVNSDLFSVIPGEEDYIAFLGRIDVYMKGLDILFEAFSKIKNKNIKLKLAGNGKEKDLNILKEMSEILGIYDRIEFLGRISEEEKKDFLGKSLFVVMPSRFEGWGIAAIESSACGKPVIGTNIPGLKDAIIHNETGILVELENSDILAVEIEKLLVNRDERIKLGNNGRAWAKKFDWDKIAEEHEKFYLEVLEKNN